jgi:diaminopimelate decarboxylase
MKYLYYNSEDYLCFDKVDLSSTVATYPTPFDIYSAEEIRRNCKDVLSCSGSLDFLPCYALKANYNPSLLKIIKQMNFGADVVSGGELFFALKSGIPPEKIVFAGVGKSKDEISRAVNEGISIRYIDLGGGIGIDYQHQLNGNEKPNTYIKKILPGLLKPFKNEKRKVLIELGRSIIGSAGLLITKILYVKETPHKKFIIVDAAMNNLIRPSLYDAYHQILPLNHKENLTEVVDIVGPVCETSDFFAKDRSLPVLNEGDYLAITGAGAYGQALSSNYNLRPMIAEHLVEDNRVQTIFKGESIETIASKYKT